MIIESAIEMTSAHRAAIDRLPQRPGTCGVSGCGKTLVCVHLERWDGKDPAAIPPARFGCPEHDVWLGHCFDEGYPEDPDYKLGLYEAVLRDVSDAVWSWLPECMRAAASRAGFGVRHPYAYPAVLVGTWDGRWWATDRHTLIAAGPAANFASPAQILRLTVHPPEHTAAAERQYLLPARAIATAFRAYGRDHRCIAPRRPSEAGYGAQWDEATIALDSAVIPKFAHEFVASVYPDATWYAARRTAPVFAKTNGQFVAAVMPIDTVEHERIERGEVCQARHDKAHDGGRFVLNYGCDLAPGHPGTIHEIGLVGGAKMRWDEREYPRTDTAAGVPS